MAQRRHALSWSTNGLFETMPSPYNKIAPVVQRRVAETLRLMLGHRLSLQEAMAMLYVRGFEDAADAMDYAEAQED